LGDPFYTGQSLDDWGKTLLQLGRFDEARERLTEALQMGLAAKQQETVLSAYGHLASLEEKTGNYPAALAHWGQYNELRDTVYNQNTRNQIAALDIRFQTAERQNRIKALEAENQIQALRLRQRNIILWTLTAGLAILLALLYLLRRNAKQRQELARQAAELQKQEISRLEQERDLIALRSRIEGEHQERLRIAEDLHDDFGSGLSKISLLSEVVKQEAQQELPTLNKIIASSRQLQRKMGEIVWALNTGNDSLSSLVAYLRRYLAEFFDDTSIQYRFQAPDQLPDHELSGEERRNLFLVVKEALHNVLKHSQADQATVSVELKGSQLTIQVADNGQGLPAEQTTYGNGLRNMEKRMENLGGSLSITSEQGTRVSLQYPLR
jgi:signal transduction histidine kinase